MVSKLQLVFVILASTCMITEGFNLFEFLERKFSQVRPKYQPNPKNRIQHYRRPAPRWPRPQLQYNYDTPQDNIVDEQPIPVEAPPQPPRYSYSRPNEISRPAPVAPYDQKPQEYLRPQPPPNYESSNEIVRQQQHYETHEPEQPADIPIIVGQFIREQDQPQPVTRQPSYSTTAKQYEYDYADIEIITAPPSGTRHYKQNYEVQVGTKVKNVAVNIE